jgi:predicted kinase
MGLPGSGKTTLAGALAPRIPARIVSRDSVREAMFRPCSFGELEKAAAFEAVRAAVAVNCELGHSTIVDGMPFSREGELEAVSHAAAAAGCRTLAVFCSLSIEAAQRRVARQGQTSEAPAADRDAALVAEVAERFRPLPEGTLELDATRPTDELAEAVVERIRQGV